MYLTQKQISENYKKCFLFTSELLKKEFHKRGHEFSENNSQSIDLIQSVIGHDLIVNLIQNEYFSPESYTISINHAISEVKKILFPDTRKKRFLSLDDEQYEFLINDLSYDTNKTETGDGDNRIERIYSFLSPDVQYYFENILLSKNPSLVNSIIRLPKAKSEFQLFIQKLEQKLILFKKFYPNGDIDLSANIDNQNVMTKKQIIDSYLYVYLGINKFFPPNFLQKNAKKRAAIITRFLIEKILESTPGKILSQNDELFFIKHKLQNVYRYFNYSFNRVLGNAYPDIIHPWLNSRAGEDYWIEKENRIHAIRWLVEEKLNINPSTCFTKISIARTAFAENGLSYLFNTYYNSVSSALREAYPEKEPWELGNVALKYWTDENASRAIKWLIQQQKWNIQDLPEKIRSKELNRKTFSEYGLATLFEKKFNKNFYNTISTAFPGQFEPWELGKVSSKYWYHPSNILHASKWIAQQEGINENQIVQSIYCKQLTASALKKYSIGQVLKKISNGRIDKLFDSLFWKEHRIYLEEQKILRKIRNQKTRQTNFSVLRTLLYGLFAGEAEKVYQRRQRTYRRISQRISSGYFT